MTSEPLWVFGYGSLMWRPGFDHAERVPATLHGFHRSLCLFSHVHRGTPEKPGLVLGLDHGGSCRGVAFRVPEETREPVLAYLRERELVTSAYREISHPLRLADGRLVRGVAYVVDIRHPQYAGRLPREAILAHVLQGVGRSGTNPDYVMATQAHLVELGIQDSLLAWLSAHLEASPPPPLSRERERGRG
jgi:glutathione-specific gamma-glutamylcyclotransferase